MSAAQAKAHQERHGFAVARETPKLGQEAKKLPKPRQNKVEAEYGLILEAMKRKGEIAEYRPFGIRLEWGADPKTGKPMVYTPDFVVKAKESYIEGALYFVNLYFVEVKGGYIHPQDWIRFKGCRAEWPMFRFELHQKTSEGWRKIL